MQQFQNSPGMAAFRATQAGGDFRPSSGVPLTGYGEPGGWSRDRTLWSMFFYGILGYAAFSNHLDVTGDHRWALRAGLNAVLRWKVWFGSLVVWGSAFALSVATMYFWPLHQPYWLFLAVTVVTGVLGQGVTYVLAIDASLFKQRFAYRVFYKLAYKLRNVPWGLLSMVAILPWGYVAAVYSIDSLVGLSLRVPLDY